MVGERVPSALQSMGVEPVRTAPRSPWQNPYVERFGGTLRRELLDKIIVFNQTQLHRVVSEFLTYYHEDRCHLGLEKDAPEPRGSHTTAFAVCSGGSPSEGGRFAASLRVAHSRVRQIPGRRPTVRTLYSRTGNEGAFYICTCSVTAR